MMITEIKLELNKVYNEDKFIKILNTLYIMKGYKTIWKNNKQMRLHRYLMENKLGRKLDFNEIVHHKDRNKLNNDINNLEIISRSEHMKIHKEIHIKSLEFKTKYFIDKKKLLELYVEKRLSTKKIEKIMKIPFTSINWFIRKHGIKRKDLFCDCGNKAHYTSKRLCKKCYLKGYYNEHK